jgi:hypothetical protein
VIVDRQRRGVDVAAGNKGKASETDGFSQTRLKYARTVLAYSRELALKVRDGGMRLDQALATVNEARKAINSSEAMMSSPARAAERCTAAMAVDRSALAPANRRAALLR